MIMSDRKIFIIDTCVLLYDKDSIHSFPENDVLIPLVVLDELDRFKDKKGLVGENARYVNRFLDDLRKEGSLHTGIELENGQTIKVALSGFNKVPVGLDPDYTDNKMISLALGIQSQVKQKVILVTKDINFRVKCDSLGIHSEDYYKDKIQLEDKGAFKGYSEIESLDPFLIDELYDYTKNKDKDKDILEELLDLFEEKFDRKPYENEYFCVKYDSSSFLGRYEEGDIVRVRPAGDLVESFARLDIKAKNREQLYALNSLLDPSLPLVTISGLAGSGKTFITLMAAYAMVQAGYYDRIVFTRNVQPVGRDIGFLPGSMEEKMAPWLAPIMDNLRVGLKDNNLSLFNTLRSQGVIEIAPLSFIRGRTFNDTILIMDEAQNATIHELKTVITRMGENSKIILLGDVDQIDTPYIDALSNGLTIVSEKFKNQSCASHIALKRGERSHLSAVAASILG
jgi:PhoH-like ATPase